MVIIHYSDYFCWDFTELLIKGGFLDPTLVESSLGDFLDNLVENHMIGRAEFNTKMELSWLYF